LHLDPDREARIEKIAATGKYDRKAIRARIEVESWVDEQLEELLGEDHDVELDLDEVAYGVRLSKLVCDASSQIMEDDKENRKALVENMLSSAPDVEKVGFFPYALPFVFSHVSSDFNLR
jgi:adenylosuccinate synthase